MWAIRHTVWFQTGQKVRDGKSAPHFKFEEEPADTPHRDKGRAGWLALNSRDIC